MTTYAAYYNMVSATERQNQITESRRASADSDKTTSSTSSTKSRKYLKKALEQLKPTTETITPAGIYTPIIRRGPLFQGLKPAKEAQEITPIYAGLTQRNRPLFGRSKKTASKQHGRVTVVSS